MHGCRDAWMYGCMHACMHAQMHTCKFAPYINKDVIIYLYIIYICIYIIYIWTYIYNLHMHIYIFIIIYIYNNIYIILYILYIYTRRIRVKWAMHPTGLFSHFTPDTPTSPCLQLWRTPTCQMSSSVGHSPLAVAH
jgi:hypothetical protein